ncbi:MAG TPA: hypothetical protein VEL78_05630, partial [Pyrinomonadaceae bacterium]|nr:hypothetical protein [Pyrinomonadaceae bacterium]
HEPLPSDDPRQRKPNIARARKLLGWKPRIVLREGLTRTIADFAERLTQTTHRETSEPGRSS